MDIRDGTADDLCAIVAIYNAAIAGRMATADLEPVSVEARRETCGWLSQVSCSAGEGAGSARNGLRESDKGER